MKRLTANYHTHTPLCLHAEGPVEKYVENAIAYGMKTLGFADHIPQPFPENIRRNRMACHELDAYVRTVISLREVYKNDIDIRLGLEAEYYPAYFSHLQQILKDYPIEYLLLGQHASENELDGVSYFSSFEDPGLLRRYTAQVMAALNQGCFLYMAHPDMVHYAHPEDKLYREEMTRLCLETKRLNIPLELNLRGILKHAHYPNRYFWQIAGEVGNQVIIGCDAHDPDHLTLDWTLAEAIRLANDCHLNLIETFDIPRRI